MARDGSESWLILMIVQDDVCVGIDYTLRLENGEVADSSKGRGPLEFVQGRGQIISGLERLIRPTTCSSEAFPQNRPSNMCQADSSDSFIGPVARFS